jgi:sodium-coupled neutral amino acid transporter 11
MSHFEASLALLSTIIGGGIVGIPYAMYHTGIPFGILLNLFVMLSCWYSCKLYLAAKNLVPVYVESLYEIGFVCMGRASIFLISIILLISSAGLMMIYFIVFGDTFASIIKQTCYPDLTDDKDVFWTGRIFYVLCLGVALIPIILKKELRELKLVSVTLFVAIGTFVLIFVIQLSMGKAVNTDNDYKKYYRATWDSQIVTAFSIILVAYSFQQNLFPTYNGLKIKTEKECLKVCFTSLSFSFFIYISLGILAIYMFGSQLSESVLDNVDLMTSAASYIIRVLFLIVLACHIPYIFYSGKESLLIIVDEIRY